MRIGPLPAFVIAPKLSARHWVVITAGIGAAACAYAGLYPRFDDGSLRIVLALTSAPFAAAVVAVGLGARSASKAFGLTLLYSVLLGVASAIIPAAIMANGRSNELNEFVPGCMFGAFFGAPTGMLYGLPLAALSALGWRHARVGTHDSGDRAVQIAGTWLVLVAGIALLGTSLLDQAKMDYTLNAMVEPPRGPAPVAYGLMVTSIALMVRATLRARTRTKWVDRVRAGLEPAFRLRPADLRDGMDALPRLGEGSTVVEWLPDEEARATVGHAYRMAASGTAVAIVRDESPIRI